MNKFTRGFFGNFSVSLDVKKRVAIPAPLRDILSREYAEESDRVVATVASDGNKSIVIYPVAEFYSMLDKFDSMALDAEVSRVLQLMSNKARECPIDSQGRIRIPADLLEYAEIQKQAVFCGSYRRMQMWNPDRHALLMNDTVERLPESMKHVSKVVQNQGASG